MDIGLIDKNLVEDYFYDRCDSDTAARVEKWFSVYGGSDRASELLSSLWDSLEVSMDGGAETKEAFEAFRLRMENMGAVPRKRGGNALVWFQRAAAVLLIPLMVLSVYQFVRFSSDDDVVWIEKSAALGVKEQVFLPDGTGVWLNSGSRIIYPETFSGRTRKVFFDGEGLFDVVSDRKHPFEVQSGGTLTKVYGTLFNLRSYPEDSELELSLLEGAVSFCCRSDAGEEQERMLAPGEMLVLDKGSGVLSRHTFRVDEYESWKDNKYCFRNKPLEDIVRQLGRTFDMDIVIATDSLKTVSYYMAFVNNEDIDEILAVIDADERVRVVRKGRIVEIH